ncbi:MAG TPA: redoxin domain-containing protein [Bacteroidales bacterium]|nr:redoxin domain-containing protein [Bacteroidales bacterium]
MHTTANRVVTSLLLLFFFSAPVVNALAGQDSTVVIEGRAPSYSGSRITFYRYSDYITKDTSRLCQATVDQQGHFACRFSLGQTIKAFTQLGPYRGFLYIEPGRHYQLSLPAKEKKSQAQKLNPFFEGIPIHIGIKEAASTELNYKINQFSSLYDGIVKENVNNIKGLSRKRDSVIRLLDTAVRADNSYFQHFKHYKIAGLKLPLGSSAEKIKESYLASEPIHYDNPAYMELFSTLYGDYFKDLFSEHGNKLYWIINGKQSYSMLDSLCREDSLLAENQSLREMVILNGLKSVYHDERFDPRAIENILEDFIHHSARSKHIQIARKIGLNGESLVPGQQAPDFCLYDADSNRVCLEDLAGQYIYLGFCSSKNYSCVRDFKILANMQNKHKEHFQVVIISNNEFDAMARYVNHHNYPFVFLHHGNKKEVLREYQIRAMPAYYFIDPEGRLSISPAAAPSENAEQQIYRRMKSDGAL